MGPVGAIIMGVFGAVFLIAGLEPRFGLVSPVMLAPVAVALTIIFLAVKRLKQPGVPRFENPRAGRIIAWSSTLEGVGVLVVINLCRNLGMESAILPAIAIVVALHFLPMAYLIPVPAFYGVAIALLAVGGGALLAGADTGWCIAGIGAACALWAASLLALRRVAH